MGHKFEIDVEDVEYCRHGDAPLMARLYKPKGVRPVAGVVEVHGGAWTGNDRLTNKDMHVPLAESGVFVMAIDFRMPPMAIYPASIADVNFAVRWLKSRAGGFGVPADRIGLLGTSSGGHQAMLAAMRPDDPRYGALPSDADVDASVAFVAVCWAIVDPLARYRMVREKGNQRLIDAHHAYWPDEAAMDEGAPQRILERGEAVSLPPALALQGSNDDNVTPDMAEKFAAAYRAAGGAIRLEMFPGAPHAFVARDPTSADSLRAVALIKDFVLAQAG